MRKIPLLFIALVLSGLPIVPVNAHFTLGNLTPVPRFHSDDFNHVPGPTAYVWPGSGFSSYTGLGDSIPGYQSPYPGGNPPHHSKAVYQLEGDNYSPFGAVLTSTDDHNSKGPLIFALNFSQPCKFGWNDIDNSCPSGTIMYAENFTSLIIYIPPEFDLSSLYSGPNGYNPGLVQSTFGATANDITIVRANRTDPWGPGWWIVSILGDIHWWPQHDYREWYYVRINDVIAPKIAGRYFFKIFLGDEFFNFVYPGMTRSSLITGGECGPCNQGTALDPNLAIVPYSGPTNATVPVENWPVVLVTGSIDPAIITGTIRYGTFNVTLYGRPINLPGRVRAVGTVIDKFHPTSENGLSVEARGYFNASAEGHFEVEGLAPGVYDLYASAAGYPEELIQSKVFLLPSQSLHLDGYINPGSVVQGNVYSRNQYGPTPWPAAPRPIRIELYSKNDYGSSNLVAFSPLNLTHQPYMAYDWDYFANHPNLPTPRPVAFPWFTQSLSYYVSSFSPSLNSNYNSHSQITCGGPVDACGRLNGVGPAQYWWVDSSGSFTNGGGSDGFVFKFGVQGVYGAPTVFDGHVPQNFATWIDGLKAGHYWIRAWVNGYTQTNLDGMTFNEISFDISNSKWAGDIYVPIPLLTSGTLIVTAHFHDQKGSLNECPINGCPGNLANGLSTGNRFLIAELRDNAGNIAGINFTQVISNQTSATVEINGFGLIGPDLFGIKYSYQTYQGYRDYGIPAGTYHYYLYMRGYLQSENATVSMASGSLLQTSISLHRGARLNMTLYSLDWEVPKVQRPWQFPGARLRVYLYNNDTANGYIGYSSLISTSTPFPYSGNGHTEPTMQLVCYATSTTPPFCPTGTPQLIDPNDPIGSTIVIDEWDGYVGADFDGPGLSLYTTTSLTKNGTGYYPPWRVGGFLIAPSDYRLDVSGKFAAKGALSTGYYSAYAFTYGYVQTAAYAAFLTEGGVSDLRLDLMRGINLTLYIPMMVEGLITPTQFNMSMRIRVFNEQGNLVATASSKAPDTNSFRNDTTQRNFFGLGRFTGLNSLPVEAIYESYYPDPFTVSPSPGNNPQQTGSIVSVNERKSADTFLWYGAWPVGSNGATVTGWQAFDSNPNHNGASAFGTIQFNKNFWGLDEWRTTIPYHTSMIRVFLAGVYDPFGDPLDGQQSGVLSTPPWDNGAGQKIDSLMFGIHGSSLGHGGPLTVEVDCWNEYPTPTFPTIGAPPVTNWYPAVEGLLQGESYHTIPGDMHSFYGFTNSTLSTNGLGPYAQRREWTLPRPPYGGEASGIFSLDKRGHIAGNILGFTINDELRTLSWTTLAAKTTGHNFTQYSWDGYYDMYLDPGKYNLQIAAWTPNRSRGYKSIEVNLNVSPGLKATGIDFILYLRNIQAQQKPTDILSPGPTLPVILQSSTESRAGKKKRYHYRRCACRPMQLQLLFRFLAGFSL